MQKLFNLAARPIRTISPTQIKPNLHMWPSFMHRHNLSFTHDINPNSSEVTIDTKGSRPIDFHRPTSLDGIFLLNIFFSNKNESIIMY